MPNKEGRVQARITGELRERLDRATESLKVPEPVIISHCLEAFCDYVEEEGQITFPLTLVPKNIQGSAQILSSPDISKKYGKRPAKAKRAHLRDLREVSISIWGTIPAGWPDNRVSARPKRRILVAKGTFPEGAFGLDVVGDSMNAAKGPFGPMKSGETVVLLTPDIREPKHNDIVAALCDGQTTLKRLICKPEPCTLRAESTNSAFANDIKPAHELIIQGVVIGKFSKQRPPCQPEQPQAQL